MHFNLEKHPLKSYRKPTIDPEQPHLFKSGSKAAKEAGDKAEERILQLLKDEFHDDAKYLTNSYFETGNYIPEYYVYEMAQIDNLTITKRGVFPIEVKYLDDNKYKRLVGSSFSKNWYKVNLRGSKSKETNGLKQNSRHAALIREILEFENISCPVYPITVVCGLSRDKIAVQHILNDVLVDEDELIDMIRYLMNRSDVDDVDISRVYRILKSWRCILHGVEKIHLVFVKCCQGIRFYSKCERSTFC